MKTQLTNLSGEIVPKYKTIKPKAAEMPKFTTSDEVSNYLYNLWNQKCIDIRICETFVCLYLNRQNRLIAYEIIGQGNATSTVCDIQRIFRTALKIGSQGLILAHNHPSGKDKPSEEDQKLTKKIQQGAALFDIKVLDHVILMPKGNYFSFADNNKI